MDTMEEVEGDSDYRGSRQKPRPYFETLLYVQANIHTVTHKFVHINSGE